ncbi:Ger(x)C family spore germination protein [Paenibacillus tengchongensis]|uniref:Ger(x)C family spore germination protein n=1 Tax=Paenibacillus tengchongensis TaxID=2608684 RepID=UPI00124E9494|nr:Ger(x)C family spore germination protein [Paenibacillus tengchongensis]
MRRNCGTLILLLLCLYLAGCGNRTELNELGITTATGYDGHQGHWTITYQVIVPSAMSSGSGSGGGGGGGSQGAVHTFSTQGTTIREAVAASSLEHPRKLYFAHTNIIVIGKEAAEAGIAEILDNYYRNPDARETVKVFTVEGQAKDYLKKLVPPEKLPGKALSNIMKQNQQLASFFPAVSIHELALHISSESGAAGVPELSVSGPDGAKLESVAVYQQTSPAGKLRISRLSIFNKDKMVGTLSKQQSLGLSWLNDQVQFTTISSDADSGLSAFQVRKAKVKVTPVKGPLHYTLAVKANVKAQLVESTSSEHISATPDWEKLLAQVESVIEAQIREGWASIQQTKLDLAGIGNKIHRKYPRDWNTLKDTWPEELAAMDIDIQVKVDLTRPGLFQDSFSRLLGED